MSEAAGLDELKRAGAAAVAINAPMGPGRLAALARTVGEVSPHTVVDLGCGTGGLLRAVSEAAPDARCVGVDLDPSIVALARQRTPDGAAVRYEVGAAAEWQGSADALLCVAASHAFGGFEQMLDRLRSLVSAGGIAIVGDGIYCSDPDRWCTKTFGALPSSAQLRAAAQRLAWDVTQMELASLQEWDDFEETWIRGVEALQTPEARSFAAQRRADYGRYRGVLGFAYLVLRPA